MVFDPNAIPAKLKAAVDTGTWVPLVGAGLSKQASRGLPNWQELLELLLQRIPDGRIDDATAAAVRRLVAAGESLLAAEYIKAKLGRHYGDAMREIFDLPQDVEPAPAHYALLDLDPEMILTTNYDRLLERACTQRGLNMSSKTHADLEEMHRMLRGGARSKRPLIFHLHGDIEDPATPVLTERDYRNLIFHAPGYRMLLSAVLLTRTVLMIGFSGSDPELRLVMAGLQEAFEYKGGVDYALMNIDAQGPLAERLEEDYGIYVIPYEPGDPSHPEVLAFLQALAGEAPEQGGHG